MNIDHISEDVIPVRVRKLYINKHGWDLVEECLVYAFYHSIVLRNVQCGHLMLDALVLEIVLGFTGNIFAPFIRAKSLDMLSSFHFSLGNELLKVV